MKILSIVWFVTGIALMVWAVSELWQVGNNEYLGPNSGAFKATLIAVVFSLICIYGSINLMLRNEWGRVIILIAAIIALFYALIYLLLGGIEDTGRVYFINVAALFLLSIVSIIILVIEWRVKKPITCKFNRALTAPPDLRR